MTKRKIYIVSPAERDTVVMILAHNGYTVCQGKDLRPGSKTAKISYVEYWRDDDAGTD